MINMKLRYKQRWFWAGLFSLLFLLAQQLGLKLPENISAIVNTILSILTLLGIINDPTTKGLSDSERALNYEKLQ
ncbi:MAG: phage holin [Streptococcus sp.]|nr:phage holin [Streptococcus sp.]